MWFVLLNKETTEKTVLFWWWKKRKRSRSIDHECTQYNNRREIKRKTIQEVTCRLKWPWRDVGGWWSKSKGPLLVQVLNAELTYLSIWVCSSVGCWVAEWSSNSVKIFTLTSKLEECRLNICMYKIWAWRSRDVRLRTQN